MKNISKSILLLSALAVAGGAQAANSDLIVTSSGGEYTFDFVNNDNVASLDFTVAMKGVTKMDTSGCVSGLPSTHKGQCQFADGVLKVIIYSPNLEALDSGPIGFINVAGGHEKAVQSTVVNMFNADGSAAGASVLNNFGDEMRLKDLR